jgi:hypothetical protein
VRTEVGATGLGPQLRPFVEQMDQEPYFFFSALAVPAFSQ